MNTGALPLGMKGMADSYKQVPHPRVTVKFGHSGSNGTSIYLEIRKENWGPCVQTIKVTQGHQN